MEKNGSKKEEAKYKSPGGETMEFHTDSLSDFFMLTTLSLSSFADLLKDSEDEKICGAGQALNDLLEYAIQQIEKKAEFIEKNLGEISIDIARERQVGYPPGGFLGLNFTPKNQGQA